MQKLFILFSFVFLTFSTYAQEDYDAFNKGNALIFKLGFGAHLPGGDLADRFDVPTSIGSGVEFITSQSNWIIGADYNFFFGNRVNEDVLAPLRTDQGQLIANDRSIADIQLRMRGFYAGMHVGKLFGIGLKNPRSGIRVSLGAGVLQHKIRIQDDPFKSVPQLSGEYKKGYDRLTNGFTITESIGYQILSKDKRVNLFLGFELTQAFTQNRRDFNFDTREKDDTPRLDLLSGFRVSWMLPFYFGKEADEIYY